MSTANAHWSLFELFSEPFQVSVLDVGAAFNSAPPYEGLFNAGRARIIGFEPDPQECERLNQAYGPPHRFYPHFIGDGRPATFHETNWVLTGSLYAPNSPLLEKFQNLAEAMRPVAQHPVGTRRLDDIADLGDIDFIKIDVQGAELSVFENALKALGTAVMIQTEVEFVEMYRGQPLFADVDRFLRSQGYQFHAFESTSGRAFKPLVVNGDPNNAVNQVLWADAVYVRDWMRLEALSEDKLRKYAVLAHDVIYSYDLAHLLLSALDLRTGGKLAAAYLKRLTAPPQG